VSGEALLDRDCAVLFNKDSIQNDGKASHRDVQTTGNASGKQEVKFVDSFKAFLSVNFCVSIF
jgi:hypothetical protein